MLNSKKNETKKDSFVFVMIIQSIVCAVLIVIFLLALKSGSGLARILTEGYKAFTKNDYSSESVSDAFVKLEEYAEAFANNSENVNEGLPSGGKDIVFSSLDALEGVCMRDVQLGFDMISPLNDYVITSRFGYRISPISGNMGVHTGLDMAADYGQSIYACADGSVLESGWDSSYGNYVKLQHKDNVVSIYAHCSKLCVDVGDLVKAGDVIAKVGSTGDSTGNHLHFEVRQDNIRINPENLFA